MLDKRRSSALSTHRNNFIKQVIAFDAIANDVKSQIEHIQRMDRTCSSINVAANRSKPDPIFICFPDIPDNMLSTLISEGELSAMQIRQFEKSLEDTTLRMKLIAGEAMSLIEQEESPDVSKSADIIIGMQVEHILEIQDILRIYMEEFSRLSNLIRQLLHGGGNNATLASLTIYQSTESNKHGLNHSSRETVSGWYKSSEISDVLRRWDLNSSLINNDKGMTLIDF